MNIFSWNINRFDGNKGWYYDKNNNKVIDKETEENRGSNCKNILLVIEKIIEHEDDIAILQEVPLIDKDSKSKWEEIWKGEIEKNDLKVFSWMYSEDNISSKNVNPNSINHTVAITKKETKWEKISIEKREIVPDFGTSEEGWFNYANKYIEMENKTEKIVILGVHGKHSFVLHKALKNMSAGIRPDIMIGDFNAGDYPARDEFDWEFVTNRDYYNSILRDYGYIDLCDGVTTFRGGTAIDHCLIKTVKTLSYDHINTEVSYEEKLSDHFSIKVEMQKRILTEKFVK